MVTTDEAKERRAGRPRSQQSQQAVLTATLEVLADDGYSAMSIEQVAARAGVGKTTIYRWWPSKEELVVDALKTLQVDFSFVNTGNFRNDAVILLQNRIFLWETHRRLILRLVGEMHTRPELLQIWRSRLFEPCAQLIAQRFKSAQECGELRNDVTPQDMLRLIIGPIWHCLVFSPELQSVSHTDIEKFVDMALQGLIAR